MAKLDYLSLKLIRKEKKITQKQLAQKLGKAAITVHKWENGERNPGEADIRLIANILNIGISEISDLKELQVEANAFSEYKDELSLSNLQKFIDKFQNVSDIDLSFIKKLHNTCSEQKNEIKRLFKIAEQHKNIVNSIPDIIYVKDRNLKYKTINNSFLYITAGNYTKNDILNSGATDIFGYKVIEELLKLERQAIGTGEKISSKVTIPNTNKTGFLTITPHLDDKGEVDEIICSITDISELTDALDRQNELVEIINELDDMIWIKKLKPKEEFKFVSAGSKSVLGYSALEMTADPETIRKNIHEDDLKRIIDTETGYFKCGEHCIRVKDSEGIYKILDIKIFNKNSTYYGIVRDVTIQNEKELIMKTLIKALDRSDIGLWMSYLPKGSDSSVENYRYSFISPNMEKIHHAKISAIESDSRNWINYVFEKDRNKVMKFIIGKGMKETRHLEYRIISPSGSIKWISSSIYKLKEHSFYGYIIDITERKESERQNKAILAALQTSEDSIWLKKENEQGKVNNIFFNKAVGLLYNESLNRLMKEEQTFRDKFIVTEDLNELKKTTGKIYYDLKLEDGTIKNIEETLIKKTIFGTTYFGGIQRDISDSVFNKNYNNILIDALNNIGEVIVWLKYNESDSSDYIFISNGIEKLTGYNKKELYNNSNFWEENVHPDDFKKLSEKKFKVQGKFQYRFMTKNKGYRTFEDLCYTHKYKKREIIYGIIRDITDN